MEDGKKDYIDRADGYLPRVDMACKVSYKPEDIDNLDYSSDLGDPGEFPFTRGIYKSMYRDRYWVMRELVGFGTGQETSNRVLSLQKAGTTGVNVAADLPTSLGLDSDHPIAKHQVAREGVPLCSLRDMEELFSGMDIEKLDVSLAHGPTTSCILMAQYIAMAEKRGIDQSKLKGTIQNNPIQGRFRGYLPSCSHLDIALRTAGDVIEYCTKNMPLWNPTNVNMFCYDTYRPKIGLEIAITFSEAKAYIHEVIRRGLSIDDVAPKIAFFCGSDINLFEEVAKFRAARRIWAHIVKDEFGAENPNSWKFRFGAGTSGHPLYPQEPLNNIVRLTVQALALVLGGVSSLYVCGYDEPIALPTEESHRLSLRIQQIIAYESGVANIADPLGGSYYIEYLTNRVEKEAKDEMTRIENKGGIIKAIETGWLDKELEKCSYEYYTKIQTREIKKVGVNIFKQPSEKQKAVEVHRASPESAEKQNQKIVELRKTRNNEEVKRAISVLFEKAKAKNNKNLMPYIIQCVKA